MVIRETPSSPWNPETELCSVGVLETLRPKSDSAVSIEGLLEPALDWLHEYMRLTVFGIQLSCFSTAGCADGVRTTAGDRDADFWKINVLETRS